MAEAGGAGVEGQPQLCSKLESSLSCRDPVSPPPPPHTMTKMQAPESFWVGAPVSFYVWETLLVSELDHKANCEGNFLISLEGDLHSRVLEGGLGHLAL